MADRWIVGPILCPIRELVRIGKENVSVYFSNLATLHFDHWNPRKISIDLGVGYKHRMRLFLQVQIYKILFYQIYHASTLDCLNRVRFWARDSTERAVHRKIAAFFFLFLFLFKLLFKKRLKITILKSFFFYYFSYFTPFFIPNVIRYIIIYLFFYFICLFYSSDHSDMWRRRRSHLLPSRQSRLHDVLHVWRWEKTPHAMSTEPRVQPQRKRLWLARERRRMHATHAGSAHRQKKIDQKLSFRIWISKKKKTKKERTFS